MLRLFLFFLILTPTAYSQDHQLVGRLLQSAYSQLDKTVAYDPAYEKIGFPGGDVPIERGVCTDVIVRAYRGVGIDLQFLVNQDMRADFGAYPRLWGLSRPDSNIDHRRVPNLAVFFKRHGIVLPVSSTARDYKPGDIVTWRLTDGRPHIGLVTDRETGGHPLVIHNIGEGAKIEDALFEFSITGHYRYGLGPDQAGK
jgi:uncharacterized protein